MPVNILVVDDSASMRKIIEMTFAAEDAQVMAVPSGDLALRKMEEWKPDVVLADATLESLDGYELARSVRTTPSLSSTAVILMVSQHTPYDAERGRMVGLDDHISKPFDTQALIDRVSQVLSRPRAAMSIPPQAGSFARPSRVEPPASTVPTTTYSVMSSPPSMGMPKSPPTPQGIAPRQPLPAQRQSAPAPAKPPAQVPPYQPGRSSSGRPVLELAEEDSGSLSLPAAPPGVVIESIQVESPADAFDKDAYRAPGVNEGATQQKIKAHVAQSMDYSAARVGGLGLTKEQTDAIMRLTQETIERVVWEIVPELAEAMIREELKNLLKD